MADVAELLARQIVAPPPPDNGPGLVRYAGGRRPLAQQLSGLGSSPRRRDYPDTAAGAAQHRADYTRWRTAERRAQRWDDQGRPGKQVRGQTGVKLDADQRRRLRQDATRRRTAAFRRDGSRNRIKALVVFTSSGRPTDSRIRELPAGGPGQVIDGATMGEVIDLLTEDPDDGAELYVQEFLEAYDLPQAQLREVHWVRCWPDGTPEPGGAR